MNRSESGNLDLLAAGIFKDSQQGAIRVRWRRNVIGFLLAAINSLGALATILLYLGIGPERLKNITPPAHPSVWLIVVLLLFGGSFGLSVYGLYQLWRRPQMPLPEKRPKVVPSRYGDASGNATGKTFGESLVLDNDGEPAFDVSIEPIEFGGWSIQFDGITRLTKTAECPAYISRSNDHVSHLYDPWLKWWQEGLGGESPPPELDLIINYRDFDGARYRTLAKLKRDGIQPSGWTVIFIRQEIIESRRGGGLV